MEQNKVSAQNSDHEIAALQQEVQTLEQQISALHADRADIEKLLINFNVRHDFELGDLIRKILNLRKQLFERDLEKRPLDPEKRRLRNEANDDFENFEKRLAISHDQQPRTLTEDEHRQLKERFRAASKLCHPDMVAAEYEKEAQSLFAELKDAYDVNDLSRVSEILSMLESNTFFCSDTQRYRSREWLVSEIKRLGIMLSSSQQEILRIRESNAFCAVSAISDWDDYFVQKRADLSVELVNVEGLISRKI